MQKYYQTTIRLWNLLKPFHKHFYLQILLNALDQFLKISSTYIIARILDALISKNINFLIYMFCSYILVNIFSDLVGYISIRNTLKNLEQSVIGYLQIFSLKNIFNLNISQYTEDHSAIKLQIVDRGEAATQELLNICLMIMLPFFLQTFFILVVVAFYSVFVALVAFFTILTTIIWSNYFANYHRPFIRKTIEKWDFFRKMRTEAFQHLSLVKVSAAENSYSNLYSKERTLVQSIHLETWTMNQNFTFKRNIFLTISRLIAVLILIFAFLKSTITAGSVYAILSWVNQLYQNIKDIVKAVRQVPLRFVEIEKYLDVIDKKPAFFENGKEKFVAGDIVFKDLSFKYPKSEQEVLQNISLTIPYGKKVAFVGTSGSGKSTIIKLLLRIYDYTSGEILIKNIFLRDINAKNLRHNIGYVEQHVDLFDATIRENILFGLTNDKEKNKVDEKKIKEVVHKARIDQFFHRIKESGLDTVIGERGVKLSGGERQRIGIARALIKDPAILIFDEATASLDTENEKYIQEAIDESSVGRTSIIIAHRLSTVQNADIIFVIDKGSLVAQGTHDELLESSPEYQVLIKNQHAK